ncbi:MAG: sigma 54-interacting transcriptional regulator, partial [Muribaculaceae bacterium]|nr:sigma 54-interacting transcriptional regulator [Muribaculaceae bacterium]
LQEQTFEPLGDSRSRRVDMRVICATNADLPAMVADRTFREDLFYRINLITVTLPPLRERRDDIPLLAKHFAAKASVSSPVEFSAEALGFLTRLPYPGNIRELKNLVERTIIVSGRQRLEASDFESQYTPAMSAATATGSTLDSSERQMIIRALESNGGNLSRTAMQLGISRQALYRRMEKFDIRP